jgi:chemotaxis signal transduction protein
VNAVVDSCWRRIGVYGGDQSCERLVAEIHCRNCPVFHDAARGAFARDGELQPSAALLESRDAASEVSALVFRIGSQWLGVATRRLAEVAADRSVRRLAHRTAGRLEGAVNVRGELHLCISLAELLGLGTREQRSETARLILLRDPTGALLAFRADEVRGLHRYKAASVEPPPDTLSAALKRCVVGLVADGERRIALMRDDAVVDLLEEALFE